MVELIAIVKLTRIQITDNSKPIYGTIAIYSPLKFSDETAFER